MKSPFLLVILLPTDHKCVHVEMAIERNMLFTFMNIARNKLSVEYHILSRELVMKNENGKIFINRIQEILEKYGLGKVEEYLHSTKAKEASSCSLSLLVMGIISRPYVILGNAYTFHRLCAVIDEKPFLTCNPAPNRP
jgi:hypothetical protein